MYATAQRTESEPNDGHALFRGPVCQIQHGLWRSDMDVCFDGAPTLASRGRRGATGQPNNSKASDTIMGGHAEFRPCTLTTRRLRTAQMPLHEAILANESSGVKSPPHTLRWDDIAGALEYKLSHKHAMG
jgi:hypothetical protein